MIKIITAVSEYDDEEEPLVCSYAFEVPNDQFDLKGAIAKASSEYLLTYAGASEYEHNCETFNIEDFDAYVPDFLCRKYGFNKIETGRNTVIDLDKDIYDDSLFPFERKEPDHITAYLYYLISEDADANALTDFLGYDARNMEGSVKDAVEEVYRQMPDEILENLAFDWIRQKEKEKDN